MNELDALKAGKWLSAWTKDPDSDFRYWRCKPGNSKAVLVYWVDNKWRAGNVTCNTAKEAMNSLDQLLAKDGWYLENSEKGVR